jgi:hypothetical protein
MARPRPHLVADAPGVYVFQLTVRDREGRVGRDQVRYTVDPLPSVNVDTMASRGSGADRKVGIKLGDQFYEGTPGAWAHVVVVDLATLELQLNKSYDCPAATGLKANEGSKIASCLSALDKDVRPFYAQKKRFAIIATNHPPGPRPVEDTAAWNSQPPVGLRESLVLFDIDPNPWTPANGTVRRGRVSVITMTRGNGSFNSRRIYRAVKDLTSVNRVGRITGRLAMGTDGLYGYQPTDPLRVDTQYPGGAPGESRIAVEDKLFSVPTSGARGGFHVLALDADEPMREFDGQQAFFATGSTGFDPNVSNTIRANLDAMLAMLKANTGRNDRIVVVATRGNPAMTLTAGSQKAEDLNNVVYQIVNELEKLGATRNASMPVFYSQLPCGGCSYALIGPGNGLASISRKRGEEVTSESPGDPAGPSRLRAGFDLSRVYRDNAYGTLGQTVPGEFTELGAKINETLNQAPTPWPEEGDSQRVAAIQQIGRDVFSNPSPRTRYWTVPYSFESWSADQKAIARYCEDAKPGTGTDSDSLAWACRQLSDEIDWLTIVRGRLNALALPFRNQSVASWAQLESIANGIRTQVDLGESEKERKARNDFRLGFEIVMEIGGLLPGVDKGFEAIQAMYEVSMAAAEMGTVSTAGNEGTYESTVGQVGKDMVRQMNAFQSTIDGQMADELVSDYGKLGKTAACFAGRKECASEFKDDPDDWQITKQQLDGAARVFPVGMRATAYGALLPARYTLWRIRDARYDNRQQVEPARWDQGPTLGQPCPADKFNQAVVGSVLFLGNFYPFANASEYGRLDRWIHFDAPRNRSGHWLYQRTNLWDILGLGYLTGEGVLGNPYEMHVPTEAALKPLFGPVDTEDLDKGGLDYDPETFYMRAFNPVPFGGKDGANQFFPQKYPYRDNAVSYDETLCHSGS